MLTDLRRTSALQYRVVAIDPTEARRSKMQSVFAAISEPTDAGSFVVASIEEGKEVISRWTRSLGCNIVLEVCISHVQSPFEPSLFTFTI